MNAIARTIRTRIPLISFTSRGFVGFLLVLALIMLIIFLPEITGVHVRRVAEQEESVIDSTQPSALSGILSQINEMSERKPFAPTTRELANQTLHEKGISWEVIRSEPVRAALIKARTQCGQLLESLPADKTFSRFALANYQLALEQISAGKDDRFSASGALGYIRHLDQEVTAGFTEEGVEGPLFRRWAEISLGEALQTAENRQFREGAVTRFDPQLSLNKISMHRVLSGTPLKANNFTDMPRLVLEGSILFEGVSRLTLYRDRKLVTEVEIPRPRKRANDPHVFFTVETDAINGIFSLRAESSDREVYIKSYSFFPRILQLVDSPKQVDVLLGTFRQRLPRLDRYFLVGESVPDTSEDGLARF